MMDENGISGIQLRGLESSVASNDPRSGTLHATTEVSFTSLVLGMSQVRSAIDRERKQHNR
jgi:hypothetical protein